VKIFYRAFDSTGVETIRMGQKPGSVLLNGKAINEVSNNKEEGYQWMPLVTGGYLVVHRIKGTEVTILE
jgi:hypothetical protein